MTFKQTLCLSVSSFLLTLGACTAEDTSSLSRAIIETPCADDSECPSGFECEIEEEHGTTTSFCQEHEENDGTCPAGFELEVEHGQTFCQPHGGDDGDDDGSDDDGSDDDGTDDDGSDDDGTDEPLPVPPGTIECETDADCDAGLECEIELEHGVTTAFCQPHGGADD